jgi:hypothetical protein
MPWASALLTSYLLMLMGTICRLKLWVWYQIKKYVIIFAMRLYPTSIFQNCTCNDLFFELALLVMIWWWNIFKPRVPILNDWHNGRHWITGKKSHVYFVVGQNWLTWLAWWYWVQISTSTWRPEQVQPWHAACPWHNEWNTWHQASHRYFGIIDFVLEHG